MNLTYRLEGIPNGEGGVSATLAIMRRLILDGRKNPVIRQLAVSIVNTLPSKSYRAEAQTIQEWVRRNVRYVRDIRDVETVAQPDKLLEIGAGDCDDQVVLALSLLEAIGHPTRMLAVSIGGKGFSHVLGQTKVGKEWVTVETTENVPLGWFPENVTRVMVRNV